MIKRVVYWETLITYARELGQARLSGDEERIKKAQERHDAYTTICLDADEMKLPIRFGDM